MLLTRDTREKVAIVEGTYKPAPGLMVHKVRVLRPIRERATADGRGRTAGSRRDHAQPHRDPSSARGACARCLGPHVKQAGSVVEPGRLRFDFTHYTALDAATNCAK